MKKLWLWLTVLLTTTFLLVAWRWPEMPWAGLTGQKITDRVQISTPLTLPTVEPDRLLRDLNFLAFERYTASDRQRARKYIRQELEAAGWQVEEQPFWDGVNLYAERSGSDPSLKAVLLGAHYDTVENSPGVDDNGTGVATVLEAARLLGSLSTPRSLKLVLFDLEEEGLLGSTAYVEQVAKTDLRGAIVLDMLGYRCEVIGCQSYPPVLPLRPPTDRGNFLAAIGDQSHPDLLESFVNQVPLPLVLTLSVPTLGGVAADLVRSDHAPFWHKGIGAVLVTDTANFRNPHYHQPSDTVETIDPEFFVGSAQQIIHAVARLLQS
ncbi:MAG: M28 family peptidase [Elainella sp. Prado103]|jgi:hypothetical protein|nr:M28 family peptidase [Elainella sp. Prado103]